MSLQQSFHPLLSNAALYDRMFHDKPYTKCIQCLSNDKLKCRKCMQNIIEEISKNDLKKTTIRIRDNSKMLTSKFTQFRGEEMKKSKSAYRIKAINCKEKENVMITSKYNWWLAQRIRKRQTDIGLKGTWPRKIRSDASNFDNFGAKKPKFQKWEKKLLDKFLQKKQNTQ